jgi:hypothetical protein
MIESAATENKDKEQAMPMNWKQKALYDLMSDISEDCYCAGWMMGNEYILWEILMNPNASRNYGQAIVTPEQIAILREISTEIGGWIRWRDEDEIPALPLVEWGPVFCPMAEWLILYEQKMRK